MKMRCFQSDTSPTDRSQLAREAAFLKRCPKHSSEFWLLYKNNQSKVSGVRVGPEFDLNVLVEDFSFLKLSNLDEFLNNGNVCEEFPSIFAMRNLRFRMIKSDRREDIGIPLLLSSVHLEVGSKNRGHVLFNAQSAYAYRNLRGRGCFFEDLAHLLRFTQPQFALSIHNRLWSVRCIEPHSSNVGALPVSE